nr:hypothetical protein Iba_chr03cCG13840 [Ipomoea batatas]
MLHPSKMLFHFQTIVCLTASFPWVLKGQNPALTWLFPGLVQPHIFLSMP